MGNLISDLAEGGAKGLFTGIGGMAKDLRTAITGKDPEKEAEIQMKLMEIEFASVKAQTDINLEEAKNVNIFVSGWRPAVGWVCVVALLWYYFMAPILIYFDIGGTLPQFDVSELMALLLVLLGAGAQRTFEKVKGVTK